MEKLKKQRKGCYTEVTNNLTVLYHSLGVISIILERDSCRVDSQISSIFLAHLLHIALASFSTIIQCFQRGYFVFVFQLCATS